MLAPVGVPPAIMARMHVEMVKVLKVPAVQERLVQMGVVTVTASSPDEFRQVPRQRSQIDGAKVVRDNKIRAGE